jgi:hypothetical protein
MGVGEEDSSGGLNNEKLGGIVTPCLWFSVVGMGLICPLGAWMDHGF